MIHWLGHWVGLDDAGGGPYLFWSGFGADLPMVAGAVMAYRRYVCHDPRCKRIGLYHVDGTHLCSRHKHRS